MLTPYIPKTYIHVSNVHLDCSKDLIINYVKSKIDSEIDCVELEVKSQTCRSLKIGILANEAGKLLDTTFWPPQIAIKKFINYRQRSNSPPKLDLLKTPKIHQTTSTVKKLNIFYQNVRGLRTKLIDFREAVLLNDYDIILITESWTLDGINNKEFIGDRYTVYRHDRSLLSSNKTRGGGVFIAVKHQFPSQVLLSDFNHIEETAMKVHCDRETVIVGVVYISPGYCLQYYTDHVSSLENITSNNPDTSILIGGDYNLPNIIWQSDPDFPGFMEPMSTVTSKFTSVINYHS